MRLSLNVLTDLNCLSSDPASLHVPVPFSEAFDDVQLRLQQRFMTPGWRLTELWSESGRRICEDVKLIRQVVQEIISNRVREYEAEKAGEKVAPQGQTPIDALRKSDNVKDVLDVFMDITDSQEDLLTVAINFRESASHGATSESPALTQRSTAKSSPDATLLPKL